MTKKSDTKQETIENEDGSITIQLSKPIINFGEKITEITLREPTGKEFQKIGMVMSVDTQEKIHFDAVKVVKMAETLSGVASGSLDSLPYKQLTKIAYAMIPFFV
jgi:hypothetical protein|tara:strand:- start:328 stop:642 length:315 start_codon:yes stop_codon:yes gene_type:complete